MGWIPPQGRGGEGRGGKGVGRGDRLSFRCIFTARRIWHVPAPRCARAIRAPRISARALFLRPKRVRSVGERGRGEGGEARRRGRERERRGNAAPSNYFHPAAHRKSRHYERALATVYYGCTRCTARIAGRGSRVVCVVRLSRSREINLKPGSALTSRSIVDRR